MGSRKEKGFIWIPRDLSTQYKVVIDGDDVTSDVERGRFTRINRQGHGTCRIDVYDGDYSSQDVIEFYIDFNDASVKRWEGIVEEASPSRRGTEQLQRIKGRFISQELLDETVTEAYEDVEISEILKDLIDSYAPGYTYNNVEDTNQTTTVRWENKPFWRAAVDLADRANNNLYVDVDKDFHFFARESRENTADAIVWNDTMLNLKGLADDSSDVKNRIIVYGEVDGLPIVATAEDTDSQNRYGVKEKVLKDTDIDSYDYALDVANSQLELLKDPPDKGISNCLILPSLKPGELVWVTDPPNDLHEQFEVHKFTHRIPEEETKVEIREPVSVPKTLRSQKETDLALEEIENPNRMSQSFNLSFADNSHTLTHDGTTLSEGRLRLAEGESSGEFISVARDEDSTITEAHLRATGEGVDDVTFYVSANNGITWQEFELDEFSSFNATGDTLKVRVEMDDSSHRVDSVSVLYD